MTTYVLGLTAASLAFLLALRLRHALQTIEVLDSLGGAHGAVSATIEIAMAVLDFLGDTARHALIALAISAVSVVVYVWALLRPARWKATSMLIVGLAYAWIGGAPPEALRDLLVADERSVIRATFLVLGHLYLPTAAVQMLRAVRHPGYFRDDREERRKAVLGLEEKAAAPIAAALEGDFFRGFYSGLSSDEKRLFARISGQVIAGFGETDPSAARRRVDGLRDRWPEIRHLYTSTWPHLLEDLEPPDGDTMRPRRYSS